MKLLFIIGLLLTTPLYGEVEQDYTLDLGINLAPSFTPEAGYENATARFGIEFGVSLYKYQDPAIFKINKITQPPRTTFKLLKFGIAVINTDPLLTFSPLSVYLKDKLYLSPTLGFGKDPYTMFSVSYEMLP